MGIRFSAENIDNNAIYAVIDQLQPFLILDSSGQNWMPNESATDKEWTFYDQVFIPYRNEYRIHFNRHHNESITEDWFGEQTCLSMIHFINQKAWWLLYYYTIIESVVKYTKLRSDKLYSIAQMMTINLLDDMGSIESAVHDYISKDIDLDKSTESLIADEISRLISEYKVAPNHPMMYR